MPTNYPASLDTLTNPTGSQSQNASRTHSEQHGDLNDAVEALQATLGATGSVGTPIALRADLASPDAGKGAALVTFKQAATGTRTRTMLDKARENVSVKDFGAIGDGASHLLSASYASLAAAQVDYPAATSLTDEIDWCAWQAAINAVQVVSGAGSLQVPDGNYVINRTLVATNSITIRGMARNCAKITKTNAGDILQGGSLKVEGLSFFHQGATGSAVLTTGDNTHLISCGFAPDAANTSAMVVIKHANANIDGCAFVGSNAAQWCVDFVADTGNLVINGRVGNQTTMYGVCSGVRIRTGTGGRPEGIDIDAKIIVTGDCSVEVKDVLSCTIRGVLDQATGYGVKLTPTVAGSIEGLEVIDAYIATAGAPTTGIGVGPSNAVAFGVIGLVVSRNIMELCGTGVLLNGVVNAFVVSNNRIEQMDDYNIDCNGAVGGSIDHNILLGTNVLLRTIDGAGAGQIAVVGNVFDAGGSVVHTPTNPAAFEFSANVGKKYSGWCSGTFTTAGGTSSGGFDIPHGLAVTPSINKVVGGVAQITGGHINVSFKIISVSATNIRGEIFYAEVAPGTLRLNFFASA